MISVQKYAALVRSLLPDPVPTSVSVLDAVGLVLAADVAARLPVPPFDNSAMDGFAVRSADLAGVPVTLTVVGDLAAGASGNVPAGPGEAVRIMTGAPLPAWADAVVPIELTDHGRAQPLPGRVRIHEAVPAGRHVRRRGEDVMPGTLVLSAGEVLTPAGLAAAISVGIGQVVAFRRPRVGIIATGSELVAPGVLPPPGHIPDSNSPLLAALAGAAGADVVARLVAADDMASLEEALAGCAGADLILTSGGVSMGAFDVMRSLDLRFCSVAMQPGKPQACGTVSPAGVPVPLIALPGNPVSVLVSFHAFVAPAIGALAGRTVGRRVERARTSLGWSSPPGRRQFMPVWVDAGECHPVHRLGSGSHLIASAHLANALAVVPEDVTEVGIGTDLEIWRI